MQEEVRRRKQHDGIVFPVPGVFISDPHIHLARTVLVSSFITKPSCVMLTFGKPHDLHMARSGFQCWSI